MSYCLKTNITPLADNLQKALVNHALEHEEFKTSDYAWLYEKYQQQGQETGSLGLYNLTPVLEQRVIESIPAALLDNQSFFIKLQVSTGIGLLPHIDYGRTSGLIFNLTEDQSITRFYDWAVAEDQRGDTNFISNDKVIERQSICINPGECWLFDHGSIHSIFPINDLRITLNVLYQTLPYEDLVRLYQNIPR
jgi:hypothetical protein